MPKNKSPFFDDTPEEATATMQALPEPQAIKQDVLSFYFKIKQYISAFNYSRNYEIHKIVESLLIGLYASLRSKLSKQELSELNFLEARFLGKDMDSKLLTEYKFNQTAPFSRNKPSVRKQILRMSVLLNAFFVLQKALERIGILKIELRKYSETETMA